MKVLLFNFVGTILVVVLPAPGHCDLSNRLAALRDWPSQRNYGPTRIS